MHNSLQSTFKNFKNQFYSFEFHPLFIINLGFILGICWWASSLPFLLPLVSVTLPIALAALLKNKQFLKLLFFGFLSFFAGAGVYHQQLQNQERFMHAAEKASDFYAKILSIKKIESNQFCFKTTAWLEKEQGKLLIYSKKKPNCFIGDNVILKYLKVAPIKNEKFKQFLLRENIFGSCYTGQVNFILLNRPWFNLWRLADHVSQNIQTKLQQKMNPATFTLWQTLFLGEKQNKDFMADIKASCKNWGATHYLARSGFHLMLFIFIWHLILKIIPLTFILKQFILLFLVVLYAFLSTPSISFNRALITFLLYKFCVMQNFEIRALHIVNLAGLITLIYSPAILFYLDFQLSYSLTAALALYHERSIKKYLLAD